MSSPEAAYETALVSAIAANSHFSTLSIPTRKFRDNSQKAKQREAVVHAEKSSNTNNCPGLWDFAVTLYAVSLGTGDASQAKLDADFAALQGIAKAYAASPSSLSVFGFTTHGCLLEPGDDLLDERDGVAWQSQSVKLHIYAEQTPT